MPRRSQRVQRQPPLLRVPNPTDETASSDPITCSSSTRVPSPVEADESEEIEGENGTGSSRYNWTSATTSLLLEALIAAKLNGQQGDGGFKQTTWNSAIARIHQADQTKTPPTVVKCRSRFETLKASWKLWDAHYKQTENRSGWWDADGLPQADIPVMDIYFAQYPKFKRFRHEKVPFCDQLRVLLENRI